jgi:hypothetical protein
MFQLASDLEGQPPPGGDSELVGEVMFSNRRVERFDERPPELLQAPADNPRVQQIRGKVRTAFQDGKAGAQDEGVQHPRRHLRGHAAPLRHRPHHGRLRRGKP